jgi:hypothetical protein
MRCLDYSDPVFENSFSRVQILRLAIHDVPSGFFVPFADVGEMRKQTLRHLNSLARRGFIGQRPATEGSEGDRRDGCHAAFCRTSFT